MVSSQPQQPARFQWQPVPFDRGVRVNVSRVD